MFFDEFIAVLNARLAVLPGFVQIALAAVYGDELRMLRSSI